MPSGSVFTINPTYTDDSISGTGINYGGGGVSKVTVAAEDSGNHYLNIVGKDSSGSAVYPYVAVEVPSGKELFAYGKYTLVGKFYIDSTEGANLGACQTSFYHGFEANKRYNAHIGTSHTKSADQWFNTTLEKNFDGTATATYKYGNTSSTEKITDYWKFYYYFSIAAGKAAEGNSWKLDDIGLYFRPYYTVTFDKGTIAAADVVPESVRKLEGETLSLSAYTAHTLEGYSFYGWSTEPNGEKLPDNYTFTKNETLYALWKPVNPLHGSDYNSSSSGVIGNFGSSTNGGHIGGNLSGALATADDGTGVFRVTMTAKDTAVSTDVGDPMMYDSTVSTTNTLLTDNISGLEIRYRILNAPSTLTSSMFQIFFNVDDGTGQMLKLSEDRSYKKEKTNPTDSSWQILKVDLSSLAFWNTATKCDTVRFDPVAYGYDGMEIEFDYVKYILSDDVKIVDLTGANRPVISEENGTQTADYRSGTLTYKYNKDIGIDAADFYDLVALDANNHFNGEYTAYNPETFTYTLYAENLLKGKTYSATGINKERAGLIILNDLGTYSFKYSSGSFDDGENLFANGDFSNPYYNVWYGSGKYTTSVSNNGLLVTLTSPSNQWSTLNSTGWAIKPDKKYYVDIQFVYADTDTYTIDSNWNPQSMIMYAPQLDGLFSANNKSFWSSSYPYIPSLNSTTQFSLSSANSGKVQQITRVLDIKDTEFYSHIARKDGSNYLDGGKTATSLAQLAVDNGYADTTDNSWYSTSFYYTNGGYWKGNYSATMWTNPPFSVQSSFSSNLATGVPFDKSLVTGLSFTIKSVTVKEMYDLTFDAGVGASEAVDARYAAKDIPITLPDAPTYTDKNFVAWKGSDGKEYSAGASYTLTSAGNVAFTAVLEDKTYSVTYNSNFPTDADTTGAASVSAEDGVGAGEHTLKTEEPSVKDYIFLGWAATNSAGRDGIISSINLTGDTTVYAVWESENQHKLVTPEKNISYYAGEKSGIRFKAVVSNSQKDSSVAEYGFIATTDSILRRIQGIDQMDKTANPTDYSALTFELRYTQNTDNLPYRYSPTYVKGTDKNLIVSSDDSGNDTIGCITTGIGEDYFDEIIVVRPYYIFEVGGRRITVYGDVSACSVSQAMKIANA